jgi:hypothetical protein
MGKRETRTFPITELRASEDGKTLNGHAAVFNRWTQIGDADWGFQECVRAGAFKADIESGADVRCLFNHDSNCLLGRTASRTLRLSEDDSGLVFTADLPNTQLASDIRELVSRGDLSGCSFSFEVNEQRWTEEETDGQVTVKRELLSVKLYDVGPVTFPAYEQTDVSIRALADESRRCLRVNSPVGPNGVRTIEVLNDVSRQLAAIRIAAETEFSKGR